MKLSSINEATMSQVQRRIPILTQKYFNGNQHQANEIIPIIIKADPTHGKYTEWLIRQWKNKTALFPEDNNNLFKNLTLFHQKKSKLNDRDINNYTPASLARTLDTQFNLTKSERKKARKGELQLPTGAVIVKEKGDLTAVKITTPIAASQLSSGTQWCTATINNAEEYLDDGPLYLIYRDGKREYLVHYESEQFMDTYDENVKPEVKFEIIGFLSSVTGLSVTNDYKLAYEYAKEVIKGRFPEGEEIIATSAFYSYEYAKDVIKGRFPEGEAIIITDEYFSYAYAKIVIKGRFPEGEAAIATNANSSCYYAAYVIKGRFPEGEKAIAKNAQHSYNYTINIINGRFPEGEKAITTNAKFSYGYAKNVIKSRWSPGEAAIAKNAEWSYKYAKDVIKGRFPKGEKTITNNNEYRELYKDFLRSIKN